MGAEWDHREEKKKKKEMLIIVIFKSRIVVQDQLFLGCQDLFGNFKLRQAQRYRRILEDEGGD